MPVCPPPPIASPFPILPLPWRPSADVSSAAHSKWRRYGPVPLTRCPYCPRPEPLKRFVTRTDDNGNLGREFVKCLRKRMAGSDDKGSYDCFQILKKYTHFEWMDEYVERIQFEGYIDSSGAATRELNMEGVPQMENLEARTEGRAESCRWRDGAFRSVMAEDAICASCQVIVIELKQKYSVFMICSCS
ncbi:hypothetical protein D1007_37258 [Hordeum vulgare]|nr:hypothetical protein D1007_37258 [Hordeum vulgare]